MEGINWTELLNKEKARSNALIVLAVNSLQ